MLDFASFSHLTFDCYGTLIDWETGILAAVRPVVERHWLSVDDGRLLELYARFEAAEEAGEYRPYREVLRGVMASIAAELGFEPSETDLDALPDSVGRWPPFADTVETLKKLAARYELVIVSNVDDAMFAETSALLEVGFGDVVTAERVGSYKPSLVNFRFALDRLGVPGERVLHVAQSLFHDHVPAKELGLATVRVNRASRRPGVGVAPDAEAAPDLVVPDLQSLARAMGL